MANAVLSYEIPKELPETLPVLALRRGVLMPGVAVPFAVARPASLKALHNVGPSNLLLVVPQQTSIAAPAPADLLQIGTLARVVESSHQQGRPQSVVLQGVARAKIGHYRSVEPYFEAAYTVVDEVWPDTAEAEGKKRALLEAIDQAAEQLGAQVPIRAIVDGVQSPPLLIDLVSAALETPEQWRKEILQTIDPVVRAERVLEQITRTVEVMGAQQAVRDRVVSELKDNEREAFLRRQLKAIQEELGEGGAADDVARVQARLDEVPLTDEAREVVDREINRLARVPQGSAERSVSLDWLNLVADLPWSPPEAAGVDLDVLEQHLDDSHFGLAEVKQQVIEHLAVRKLAGAGRSDVLLLAGPPGVGKTSIAEAIAAATGRKLIRIALGGMRDTSELRGHRRTYVGSRPGRVIEGVRRASSKNAVVLFDEVDKLGRGWQGDPAAVLLEILDPEQNHSFIDHYLELPFDLSQTLFIATANDLSQIPRPLVDRMEVLEIEGYTSNEKVVIAKDHVLKKLTENAGLDDGDVVVSDDALEDAIAGWTREAGVRQLQRVLGKIFRAAAVKKAKDQLEGPLEVTEANLGDYLGRRKFFQESHEVPERPGVATGLAWTPVGGDILYVEASLVPGGKGQLVLTGQLGDVMKESAQAALTYARAYAGDWGVDLKLLESHDVHLHVPSGATPKDGPSAGVTILTALVSLLSARSVKPGYAMTGEVTLRGRVLRVGGIKSKVLAARAQGLTHVIIPKGNAVDLEELPKDVHDHVTFVLADRPEEVLAHALEQAPGLSPQAGTGQADATVAA